MKHTKRILALALALLMLLPLAGTALAAEEEAPKEEIVLTIYEQTGEKGEAKVLKSYTQSEYEALLTEESLTYSYMSEPYEMTVTGYVTLSELLGEAFGSGDTLRYMCHEKDGSIQEYEKDCARSYEDLIAAERYYYAAADAKGAVVPSVLSANRRLYVGETDGYRTQSGSFWPDGILSIAIVHPEAEARDLVILYTSDVHCGIDKGWGYAGLYAVKEKLSETCDVLLVDNGDAIQGEPIGLLSGGEAIIDIMNVMGYDAAIPGNHEFDYGMEQFLALTKKANFPYICCNFEKEGELVFDPWLIKEIGGVKIGFVGVTTPDTLRSSIPRYFQDENGNYIYGFMTDETGEAVYNAVQQSVDAVRAAGADYVIVLGHMGNSHNYQPWMYSDVISHCSGIDAWLDGHTHDTDQVVMKDRDGKEVVRAACGTKLAHIGALRITRDGKISSELLSWDNSVPASKLLPLDNAASKAVSAASDELNALLAEVAAVSEVDLRSTDPEIRDFSGRPLLLIRVAETNLGNLIADAFRWAGNADIAFMGAGSIRSDIPKGDVTFGGLLAALPYASNFAVAEVTGQQVLDALEWSVNRLPNNFGGFAQVSGLSFEYDSTIESPCVKDENGFFDHVDETKERRVRNVLVAGRPIEADATYTLASVEYYLINNGDGYTMFDGAKVLQNGEKIDLEALYYYITEVLGGHIGKGYEDMYGEGRIVSVNPELQ